MSNTAQQTREKIRSAAAQLIAEQGAAHLTLNAVADTAGISKGGLLYHYPSKQALLEGMLEHVLDTRAPLKAMAEQGKQGSAYELLSKVLAFDIQISDEERLMGQALLAASAENPELLKPAQDYMRTLYNSFTQNTEQPATARLLFVAIEGLQLLETVGLLNLNKKEKQSLQTLISGLLEEHLK